MGLFPLPKQFLLYFHDHNVSSFSLGFVQETNQLRIQLQQAQSAQLISNEMNTALQVGLFFPLKFGKSVTVLGQEKDVTV